MKGIYIHIPFCMKKCEYCDFVSFPCMENRFSEYISALILEMKKYKGEYADTVFIGGGTPSYLPQELLKKLCEAVKENFVLVNDIEWTIEANPGTISEEKAKVMLECGINRISVGVQSFNDTELKEAGRIHTADEAYNTVLMLEKVGFENISIDLMESLPMQTRESFINSLEKAVNLPIKHISVYSLIIEDGTPIKKKYDSGVYSEPDEDTDRELYHYTAEFLAKHGFERYEISNYAREGYESRHNLKYWDCDEYIGIGLAAHSYVNAKRYGNTTDFEDYIDGVCKVEEEELTVNDMQGEFMMLGLRKTCGVSGGKFSQLFGKDIYEVYGNELDRFIKLGLMVHDGDMFRLTESGLDVANSVMCEFI